MNIDSETEDQADFDRSLGSVEKEKQEIHQVMETTKDLLVELLRIQKQIDLYEGRDERFIKNTKLQQLLGDLKKFRKDIDEKQKNVKQYIAEKKAKNQEKRSILESSSVSAFSSFSSFSTSVQEPEVEEEDLELGTLVQKTSLEIKTYLDKMSDLEIMIEYAVKNRITNDGSSINLLLFPMTQLLYNIHKEGVALCDTLCKNGISPLSSPNPYNQLEVNGTFASLHHDLKYIHAYLESMSTNAQNIHEAVEKNHLTPENMMSIFKFCNYAKSFIRQNQNILLELKKLLDENDIHLNHFIIAKLRQDREKNKQKSQ